MSVQANMHRAETAEATISGNKSAAWITFSDNGGGNLTIFVDPSKWEAAKALAEYFNDNLAQKADAPQADDAAA